MSPNKVSNYKHLEFVNGDTVGMLVEFKNNTANLKFCVNDQPIDASFDGLHAPLYPVVSFMSTFGNATVLPDAKIPQALL